MTWKDHRAGHAEMSHGGTCLGLGRLIDDVLIPGLGGSTMEATWKPHEKHGELTERSNLPDSVFAFPQQRKEPMTDASHVRNAIARFDQTIGVSDQDRELAFANIKKAAKHYGVEMSEMDWHELGRRPSTGRTAEDRKKSAQKAAKTRKEHTSRQHRQSPR